jgi:hypothetical protein
VPGNTSLRTTEGNIAGHTDLLVCEFPDFLGFIDNARENLGSLGTILSHKPNRATALGRVNFHMIAQLVDYQDFVAVNLIRCSAAGKKI